MDERAMRIREQGWLQTVQAAARSGQTTKAWCEQNGVAESTFYRWKHRLREKVLGQLWPETAELTPAEKQTTAPVPVFAQLSSPESEHTTDMLARIHNQCSAPLLRIRNGELTLELGTELDEEELSKVLRAVRNAW